MEKRIITISREFGSGGRTIGKLVAEHLGIQCYDAELIQKLAVESGFDESYIKEAGEYTPGGFLASAFTKDCSRLAVFHARGHEWRSVTRYRSATVAGSSS